jgi:hypothetical membrane protein
MLMQHKNLLLSLAGTLWLFAGIFYLAAEAITAAAFPGYSFAHNYISDLGVPYQSVVDGRTLDSPRALLMNLGGFILDGAFYAAAAITAISAMRAKHWPGIVFLALGIVHSAGTILVGIVHNGFREVTTGLQPIHVIGAAFAIIGGNAASIVAAILSRRFGAPSVYSMTSLGLGIFGLFSLALLQLSREMAMTMIPFGILERGSVYPITLWEIITGVAILVTCRRFRRVAS